MKQRPVHYCYQLLSILLLISLLVSQFAAVYSAPIEAESKQYTTQTISDTVGLLFRTKVTLRQPTDFARLEEMEVVILENGEDWALILVTAQQLEDLARLRFDPRETNELESLALAHEANQPWLAKSMETTFAAVAEFESQQSLNSLDSSSTNTNEHELVAILASTTVEQQAALTILTSIDDDGDGLTNTQEGWWCTNQLNPDSDGDGVNDGDEVQAAKDVNIG